jgi:ribosomal protein S6
MAKGDSEMRVDETLEEGGTEPRVYELGFHLDSNLPSEGVKEAYGAVRDLVAGKGSIVAEGEPQKVQLAYTISRDSTAGRRDFDSAYFSWIVYEATPENHAEVISAAASNTNIIRFIDVLTTKEAARHSLEMREMALNTANEPEDPEAAMGAELDAALENATI